VAKNGKGWAMFSLEGYDESFEFRIFGEEYLKFRHFLIQNNFTFMKLTVKEGWMNQDTGKKGDPRMQFVELKQLQDVLESFAKKLIVLLNIKDLQPEFIHKLSHLFNTNKGDHQVTFEVMEIEKIKKLVETAVAVGENEEVVFEDENEDMEASDVSESKAVQVTEVEEVKVVTKLSMVSRRLKIKISNELLYELEKMQVNFKLN
jgi:DNA polymerase-3 subunit alpha